MSKGYEFDTAKYPEITIHMLVEIMAHQQAIFAHSLERTGLTEIEKDQLIEDINSAVPELKENILQQLYASFGRTPKI